MVLIQSQDFEISTNEVIGWLISFGIKFKRINVESQNVRLLKLDLSLNGQLDIELLIDDEKVNIKDISGYWHRRGRLLIDPIEKNGYANLKETFGDKAVNEIKTNLSRERECLNSFIDKKLTEVQNVIGDSSKGTLNKLSVLQKATQVGLKISPTLVTSEKKYMEVFLEKQGSIITKAILDNLFTQTPEENLIFYTEEIKTDKVESFPPNFYYSLFQQKIEKSYELRIFYLLGKFYSMAIFSQDDRQTSVDFRKYNNDKPNRRVPYELPQDLKEKLDNLMKSLDLNSGSIDMILTKEQEYIFLEVNPVGQFAMVSHPCNYPTEREIAEYLSTGKIPN